MIVFEKIIFTPIWGISKYAARGSETSTIAETLSYVDLPEIYHTYHTCGPVLDTLSSTLFYWPQFSTLIVSPLIDGDVLHLTPIPQIHIFVHPVPEINWSKQCTMGKFELGGRFKESELFSE